MNKNLKRYLANWQDEVDSAYQYRTLADLESDVKIKKIYSDLARVEEEHVAFWEDQIKKLGHQTRPRKPSWRSHFIVFVAKKISPEWALGTIAENENVGRNVYVKQSETFGTNMTAEEHQHTQILNQLLKSQPQGVTGNFISKIEGRHKAVGGNALRASVLGVNDGLCSNLSLVMGVAGATATNQTLILTGFAGLLAGAFSMALGEWISVTSSRELAEREISAEKEELELNPEAEKKEMKLIYEAKGLTTKQAEELTNQIFSDKANALDTLTREELGINPEDLGGSANEAALFSFILFTIGAIIPVFPFLLFEFKWAFITSILMSALALFGFGALITIFTGKSVIMSGSRQLVLGGLAAAITFFLGHMIGVSLN